MPLERIAVLGAGGHGAVVIAALQAMGRSVEACFDDSPDLWGTEVLGVPVHGPVHDVSESKCTHGICGVGDNAIRRQIVDQHPELEWVTVVHPFSWVHPDVAIGAGSYVGPGCTVQVGAQIGAHVILNTGSRVDHHSSVGDYAHLSCAALAGHVSIGAGCFIGAGGTVLPGMTLGEWSTVGAGGLVTKHVAPGAVVVGVPARVVRRTCPPTTD